MTVEEVMREVRRLELTTRHLVRDLVAGEFASAFRGRGVEFADVRDYQPGDDVRTIDWNVTARLGNAFVKRFSEERELAVWLLVDFSASGRFGTVTRTRRMLAAEVSALLALVAARSNDRVGAIFYTVRVEHSVPAGKGRRHALRIVNDVLGFDPSAQGTDLAAALRHVAPLLPRRALLFVVSDFLDPLPVADLTALAARHDVVALDLTDPREQSLPATGLFTLWDPESAAWRTVDVGHPGLRRHFEARRREHDRRVERELAGAGVELLRLQVDQPCGEALAGFLRGRQRRR
jgi:uncharacterized protein (DUF58 family)